MQNSLNLRSKTKTLALCGLFIAVSMILSYLEKLIPLTLLVPIPGVKLGLSNIATIVAFLAIGKRYAFSILFIRIALISLLFGTLMSFSFALSGGILSFLCLLLLSPLNGKFLSIYGISIACAALHNIGQILVASVLLKTGAVFSYLPFLLIMSIPTGALTGHIAFLLLKSSIFQKNA